MTDHGPKPAGTSQDSDVLTRRDRWRLSHGAAAFIRERARLLQTDPATVLEDLVLVERRRVEGAI